MSEKTAVARDMPARDTVADDAARAVVAPVALRAAPVVAARDFVAPAADDIGIAVRAAPLVVRTLRPGVVPDAAVVVVAAPRETDGR